MSNHSQQIVQKLWSYCNVLRDDGLSYGDYVEQLTCLLFLKMMHERTQEPWKQKSPIPAGYHCGLSAIAPPGRKSYHHRGGSEKRSHRDQLRNGGTNVRPHHV